MQGYGQAYQFPPSPYGQQAYYQYYPSPSGAAPEMTQQQSTPGSWPVAFPPQNQSSYVAPYVSATPQMNPNPMPMARPKHLSRSATTAANGQSSMQRLPARSAMRRTNGHVHSHSLQSHSVSAPAVPTASAAPPLSRSRTNSVGATPRLRRTTSISQSHRSRTYSNPQEVPDHIFVTFSSTDELRLDNVGARPAIIDSLLESVLPVWTHGAIADSSRPNQFYAKFQRTPWASQGPDALLAYRLICRLFYELAVQGYFYLTSVDVALPLKPPRLVFVGGLPDPTAHFFALTFSRSGHKMTLVDPPPAVGDTIGLRLRNAFPRQITSDRVVGEGIHVVELKRGMLGVPDTDKMVFTGYVLKYIKTLGYKLDASVPMARKGLFGLGGRKEIWIFKGPPQRRMSIE